MVSDHFERRASGAIHVEARGGGERLQIAAKPKLAPFHIKGAQDPALQAPKLNLVEREVVVVFLAVSGKDGRPALEMVYLRPH